MSATRVSGLRVVSDTVRHGLRTDGPLVAAGAGADLVSYRWNRRTVHIVRHPNLVDHVLYGGVERYHKSIEYECLRAVLGLSLFTDEDESWRRHRMMINPVLAKRHLRSLFELMVDPIQALAERLESEVGAHGEVEIAEAMTELTLDVVGSALFGRGMASLAQEIGPQVTFALRAAERATRLIMAVGPPASLIRLSVGAVRLAPYLPPPLDRIHDVMHSIDRTVWGVIDARRHQAGGRADDLLGLLLSVRDESGAPLPLRRVRDEACTFMLAGHETTANALAWMWYLLAINHAARERMLAEVDTVLGDRRPTLEDIDRLPWTSACFLEAMRVYPPAWVIPRVCVAEDDLGGHRVRRGDEIIIPVHSLHHDPRFWSDPEVFDPSRFLPEHAREHHRAAYLPFGAGRRVCAGKSFAVIEGTLVAAMLSRRLRFDVKPGFPVEPEATFTLRPRHGLEMVAWRREPASAAAA